ncbi:serine/arginine repetitive matrix protein 1-like isoform X2 [Triticum urartu]|uniref:serine/arginine repetitive matrix protein 1-like isoform X2 n=1 Tax=Triticum urartu TaxID=4572 RepID=UPI00204311C5|nr:serine/arginine repetitive matrix protein 1-like isoform X2 [Triticum urartu]
MSEKYGAEREPCARHPKHPIRTRPEKTKRKKTPDPRPRPVRSPISPLSLSISPPTHPNPNPTAPPLPTWAPPPQTTRRSPRATTSRTPVSLPLVRSSSSAVYDGGAPSAAEEQQRRPPPRICRAPGTAAPYAGGSAAPTSVEEQPAVLLPPPATPVPAPPPDLNKTIPLKMRGVGYSSDHNNWVLLTSEERSCTRKKKDKWPSTLDGRLTKQRGREHRFCLLASKQKCGCCLLIILVMVWLPITQDDLISYHQFQEHYLSCRSFQNRSLAFYLQRPIFLPTEHTNQMCLYIYLSETTCSHFWSIGGSD